MRGIFARNVSVAGAISSGTAELDEADAPIRNTRGDSILLLRHVLGIPHAELLAYSERQLTRDESKAFFAAIQARKKGNPIQHITGHQEFYSLDFHVTPDVLIPRPETEHLVEAAIDRLKDYPAPRIADIGTGSGAIAIAIAHSLPHAHIAATDISASALAIARENARRNDVAPRIQFFESDLLDAIIGDSFDAIVSNPPYVAESERKTMSPEVRDFEPDIALFAGPTGLEFYPRLIATAEAALVPGGWLIMEIGHGQRDSVAELLTGWQEISFVADLQNIPRVALARQP